MGLDICLRRFRQMENPNRVYTIEELGNGCWVHTFEYCKEYPGKPVIEGLDPSYIFRLRTRELSYRKMLEAAGKNPNEGIWLDEGGGTSPWGRKDDLHGDKIKAAFPNGDKADWWILLVQKKDIDSDEELDRVWIPIFYNDSKYDVEVEKWVALVEDGDIGYMRKGANAKFYEDDMWGSQIVCSKKNLKEHMEKYFDKKSDGRYASPYYEFKSRIYDQFEDGQGMYVAYC